MKTISMHSRNEANEVTELGWKAKAVILYDDLDTLLAVNQILTGVQSHEGGRTDWVVNSWRFDMLTLGRRLEAYRAMEESVDTELMLIAIRGPGAWARLPLDWLGLWGAHRHSRAARLLVMPFDQARERQFEPHIGVLRRMAEARALPFSVFYGVAPDEEALGNARSPAMGVAGLSRKPAVKGRQCLGEMCPSVTC